MTITHWGDCICTQVNVGASTRNLNLIQFLFWFLNPIIDWMICIHCGDYKAQWSTLPWVDPQFLWNTLLYIWNLIIVWNFNITWNFKPKLHRKFVDLTIVVGLWVDLNSFIDIDCITHLVWCTRDVMCQQYGGDTWPNQLLMHVIFPLAQMTCQTHEIGGHVACIWWSTSP